MPCGKNRGFRQKLKLNLHESPQLAVHANTTLPPLPCPRILTLSESLHSFSVSRGLWRLWLQLLVSWFVSNGLFLAAVSANVFIAPASAEASNAVCFAKCFTDFRCCLETLTRIMPRRHLLVSGPEEVGPCDRQAAEPPQALQALARTKGASVANLKMSNWPARFMPAARLRPSRRIRE